MRSAHAPVPRFKLRHGYVFFGPARLGPTAGLGRSGHCDQGHDKLQDKPSQTALTYHKKMYQMC